MEPPPTVVKWTCPMCTYENWAKSTKCTVCLAQRDLPSIEEEIVKTQQQQQPQKQSSSSLSNGWDCPQCTFINPASSIICAQCAYSTLSASQVTDPATTKWRCALCTYENWPKTIKCAMCRSEKEVEKSPWLNACKALVTGEDNAVQEYLLSSPHSPSALLKRKLTQVECHLLDRWLSKNQDGNLRNDEYESPYQPGLSLVDLFAKTSTRHRADLASLFLALSSQPMSSEQASPLSFQQMKKRSLCQTSPLIVRELRRMLSLAVLQRKGDFSCNYLSCDFSTLALPAASIQQLPAVRQRRLFSELLDTEVQSELEERSEAINWWVDDERLSVDELDAGVSSDSRLFALWNRSDGDCLLDSLLQASWGVFDKQGTLRQALSESLTTCEEDFYRLWREHEMRETQNHYHLDDLQLLRDWRSCLEAARQPRESLEQIHIFVLSHIFRRPIIVYSVKYINNFRNEPIGISNFQGVYLPALWKSSFCSKNPLILGYTRGHFSALVPMQSAEAESPRLSPRLCIASVEGLGGVEEACSSSIHPSIKCYRFPPSEQGTTYVLLPLFDRQNTPLPVPFVSLPQLSEMNVPLTSAKDLLRERLDTVQTPCGLLACRLRLPRLSHPLVHGLLNDWISIYRSSSSSTSSNEDQVEEEELVTAANGTASGEEK